MRNLNRRSFLRTAAGSATAFAAPYQRLAEAFQKKVKITDVKCMIVRGTWDWNLIRVETDSGLYGIGEAYWGWGVKDVVLNKLKGIVVGEDPLNVDKLYTKMLMQSAGAGAIAGVTVSAASGVEIALWDLAGRILQTPVCNLLGGRFRDRVRFYRTLQTVRDVEDMVQWRDQVQAAKAEKWGWTAFKYQGDGVPTRADPNFTEPGHDRYGRALTQKDYRRIVKAMETVRETLGPDGDFGIECHWRYDTQDVIRLGRELEHIKPMFLEDPVPPENIDAQAFVTRSTRTPICTGENLYRKHGFRELIEKQAARIIAPDIPKMGGLLEAKKVADHADTYYIPIAPHNVASPIGTVAAAHVCAAMGNFLVMEFHAHDVPWWADLVDGEPPITAGFIHLTDAPGHGLTLNEDVARAHLQPGTSYFGDAP
jgi:L-alanine-DL-glutamate epimerase-like enolase superfamily enzyme